MRGVSPLISTVIVIGIVFAIAAMVSPWMLEFVSDTTNQTSENAGREIKCGNAAYDFVTSYGSYGVDWDFSTINNSLGARIRNTGTVTLHGFYFELTFNDTVIEYYNATAGTQRTSMYPLRPGETVMLNASLTKDVNETLTSVKILNPVCRSVYAFIEL